MTDPADRLRTRLEAIFAEREDRLREARERADQRRMRRQAFLDGFRERVRNDILPAFDIAVDAADSHGFHGRVRSDLEPGDGDPFVRFELHPSPGGEEEPALGRAALRYEASVAEQRVRRTVRIGGGEHSAFAHPHEASETLSLDALSPESVERHLADLIGRALAVDRSEEPADGPAEGPGD